jgi:magnesium transporter
MEQEKKKQGRRRRNVFRRPPPGAAPGTLVPPSGAPFPEIRVTAFGPDGLVEETLKEPDAIPQYLQKWPVTWINIDGLGDEATLLRLGELFSLHKLALEDVVNVNQRAKTEQYENKIFFVARMLTTTERLETEQITLFLGSNYILTFQEKAGDCFDPVRARIRGGKGRMRTGGADYLAYALIDAVIDSYFPVLERYDEKLDDLEQRVMASPDRDVIEDIHAVRKDLLTMRRAVWPVREAVNLLVRDASPLIVEYTRVFLRDCYDHTIQVIDMLENLREIASGLVDLYMSGVSNRMNEVMKVLAIIATVFIPLSFIAGLYGMNFDSSISSWNMPELGLRYGYPLALCVMLLVFIGQLYYFKRKGWIGSGSVKKSKDPEGS